MTDETRDDPEVPRSLERRAQERDASLVRFDEARQRRKGRKKPAATDKGKKPAAEQAKPPAGPSQATILVDLAGEATLFHDADGIGYASIPIHGHIEHHRIRSRGFKDWLTRRFYFAEGKVPGSQGMHDAINLLDGKARFDGEQQRVFARVGEHDGRLYLDLCDRAWRAVEIDAEGWRIVERTPIVFVRHKGMLPLPDPAEGDLEDLWRFVNVRDSDQQLLVAAWLLACLRPRGPYPVLCLQGEQGSAKSTATRLLRALVDPHTVMLRTPPKDERDLVIGASRNHIVAYDNLSGLGGLWVSDALCRLATGGGFATRALYTDDDELLIDVCRPAVLNGIEDVAARNDLIDRALIIQLEPLPKGATRTEEALNRDFEQARPGLLGALLDAACVALRGYSSVHLAHLPRMADFAVWATAAEPALGVEPGRFMDAYTKARDSAMEDALEGNLVVQALERFRDSRRGERWTGAPKEFYAVLKGYITDDEAEHGFFPKSSKGLRGSLTRLAPSLRQQGTKVAFSRTGSSRTVAIDWVRIDPSHPSLNGKESSSGAASGSDGLGKLMRHSGARSVTERDASVTSVTDRGDSVTDRKSHPSLDKASSGAGSGPNSDGCDGCDGYFSTQSSRPTDEKRVKL